MARCATGDLKIRRCNRLLHLDYCNHQLDGNGSPRKRAVWGIFKGMMLIYMLGDGGTICRGCPRMWKNLVIMRFRQAGWWSQSELMATWRKWLKSRARLTRNRSLTFACYYRAFQSDEAPYVSSKANKFDYWFEMCVARVSSVLEYMAPT